MYLADACLDQMQTSTFVLTSCTSPDASLSTFVYLMQISAFVLTSCTSLPLHSLPAALRLSTYLPALRLSSYLPAVASHACLVAYLLGVAALCLWCSI